mmetsp:Transcript_57016/g.90340  ORF Transcript_57016/g.90340 Transcript_57016/m.90340 type:complete len:80 (-) Transcript_57016:653-892(-)
MPMIMALGRMAMVEATPRARLDPKSATEARYQSEVKHPEVLPRTPHRNAELSSVKVLLKEIVMEISDEPLYPPSRIRVG